MPQLWKFVQVFILLLWIILKVEIPKPLLHHRRLLGCLWWRHAGDLHMKSFLRRIEQRVTDGMSDCWVHNLWHQQQLRAVDGGRAAREGKITTIFYPTRSQPHPLPSPTPRLSPQQMPATAKWWVHAHWAWVLIERCAVCCATCTTGHIRARVSRTAPFFIRKRPGAWSWDGRLPHQTALLLDVC